MDQALVSLVDKERMRVKQANILEVLKVWMKSSAAERSGIAAASAEALATQAKAVNKVRHSRVLLLISSLFISLIRSVVSVPYRFLSDFRPLTAEHSTLTD